MFFISTVAGYVKNSVVLSKNESYFAYLREFLVPAVGNDPHWLLCYCASLHGWAGDAFHTRCDGKKDMVTIILTFHGVRNRIHSKYNNDYLTRM